MSQLSLKKALLKLFNNEATMLNRFYPVGSIYISTSSSFNPATSWGGTWEKVSAGRFLESTTTASNLYKTVAAGLPNITGTVVPAHSSGVCYFNVTSATGAFTATNSVTNNGQPALNGTFSGANTINFSASRSNSIYGNSTTVQPPAVYVYMWHRTA